MRRQQDPGSPSTPPPGPSRGAQSHFGRPTSGNALPTAASAVISESEQPNVTLDEWWLARVEGHERKIAVAGFFERNHEVLRFVDAPIAKRYEPCTLETEDGTAVFLYGFFNTERTLENGYTIEACETFSLGFPHWWENWNVRYPKMMSSQTGSLPTSSGTGNSGEDSNVPSTSTVECNNDEGSKAGIDNASCINEGHQKRRGCLKKPGKTTATKSSDKGKQPVGPSRKQKSAFGKSHHATKSPAVISSISYGNMSPLTRGKAKSFSVSTPESLKLKKTRSGRVVVPPLDSGCQNIVYGQDGSISAIVGLNSPPALKGSTSKTHVKKRKDVLRIQNHPKCFDVNNNV